MLVFAQYGFPFEFDMFQFFWVQLTTTNWWNNVSKTIGTVCFRLRSPPALFKLLHGHYDSFKHEISGKYVQKHRVHQGAKCWQLSVLVGITYQVFQGSSCIIATSLSGVPHEVLSMDYWVPGSSTRSELERFRGKTLFKEILTTNHETVMAYFTRAIQDTEKIVSMFHFENVFKTHRLLYELGCKLQANPGRISNAKFQRIPRTRARSGM